MHFAKFIGGRLLVFFCVIFIGCTIVFFVPRAIPADPVEAALARLMSQAGFMEPAAVEAMRATLTETYGLEGSLLSQYLGFFKRVLISHDFGPSLAQYPTPVVDLIALAMPNTLILLSTTTILSWLIGNAIGLLAGFRKEKWYSKAMEGVSIALYPIPNYILGLVLIIVFAFIYPVFPLATSIRGAGFNWEHIKSVVYNTFLPAMSQILVGTGWWVISMKTLSGNVAEEEYVHFARLKGLGEGRVMMRYVLPTSALPQVTTLALQIGRLFGGSLIVETLFQYPGIGMLIYSGVTQSDYNIIMGAVSISIVAVALSTLVVDLIYPFLDPRVRYK